MQTWKKHSLFFLIPTVNGQSHIGTLTQLAAQQCARTFTNDNTRTKDTGTSPYIPLNVRELFTYWLLNITALWDPLPPLFCSVAFVSIFHFQCSQISFTTSSSHFNHDLPTLLLILQFLSLSLWHHNAWKTKSCWTISAHSFLSCTFLLCLLVNPRPRG